jgi:hypothetical protein
MMGLSKRLRALYAATGAAGMAPWSLHDLRRSYRSGMGALGVPHHVAELCIGQVIGDDLTRVYDRSDYWRERVEAAERWARHVMGLVEGRPATVTPLWRRARA